MTAGAELLTAAFAGTPTRDPLTALRRDLERGPCPEVLARVDGEGGADAVIVRVFGVDALGAFGGSWLADAAGLRRVDPVTLIAVIVSDRLAWCCVSDEVASLASEPIVIAVLEAVKGARQ